MKKLFISIAAVSVLAGCATRPGSIPAAYVSHERYSNQDCVSLANELNVARHNLQKFSEQQDSKATLDAVGVFLLAIPFSKLSGDYAGDVAKYKGEVEAIQTAQKKSGCTK